jgi:hypothetical protein
LLSWCQFFWQSFVGKEFFSGIASVGNNYESLIFYFLAVNSDAGRPNKAAPMAAMGKIHPPFRRKHINIFQWNDLFHIRFSSIGSGVSFPLPSGCLFWTR